MTRTGGRITIRSGDATGLFAKIAVEKFITHDLDTNSCICCICNARFKSKYIGLINVENYASCGDLTCNEVIIKSIIE